MFWPTIKGSIFCRLGIALEEDDAGDQLVRVVHLLDRFLPLLLGETVKPQSSSRR